MDATVSVEGKYRILFYEIIVKLLNYLTAPFPKTEKKKNKIFWLLNCEKIDAYKRKFYLLECKLRVSSRVFC